MGNQFKRLKREEAETPRLNFQDETLNGVSSISSAE